MPKESQVTEIIRSFGGQKSSLPSGELGPGDAERIVNFMVRKGRLRKLWGGTLYSTLNIGGFGPILWLDYFRRRWMVQHGDFIGYEDSEGSGAFTALGSILLGSSNKVRSDKWKNRIFLVNGVENKFYEDSLGTDVFATMGIIPPDNGRRDTAVAPAVGVGAGASAFLNTEEYSYVFTWYDSTRGIESLPNGATVQEDGLWLGKNPGSYTLTLDAQTIRVNISVIRGRGYDTERVTHWKLYRAKIDGTTGLPEDDYKQVLEFNGASYDDGLIPIATDYVDDDGSALGAVLDESISPPPTGRGYLNGLDAESYGPRFIRLHNDQLWLFGVRYPGIADQSINAVTGIIYASEADNFDYWRYTYNFGLANDQKDTGLAKFRNTLVFFKEKSIAYLDGTGPTNYRIKELDAQRGVVAPGSIQETPIGIIGMAADGFILVDSVGPAKVLTEGFFDEFTDINLLQADKINSSYDLQEGKYECHVPINPSLNLNRVFSFDINQQAWQVYTKRVGQASKYDLNSVGARVGLLGDPVVGQLYQISDETIVTFNGQKIKGRWESKQFDFGEPDRLKRMVSMRIKARCNVKFVLGVDVIMDEGQQETFSLRDIDSESVYTTLAATQDDDDGNELILDQGALSAALVWKKFEILLSGVARNFRVIVREEGDTSDSSGFEIDEIVFVGNLMGR